MANAYLSAGATDFAAANWSDTTGFAANATLYIQNGTQTINSGLSPSIATGINNLDILSGFAGTIGGAGGSLAVETDSASLAQATQIPRIRYWASGGLLYYTPQGAGGAANVCDYFQVGGSGSAYVNGTGTVKRVECDSGRLYVATTIDGVTGYRWVLSGGSATIDGVSGSTKLFSVTITGGQHIIKKGVQGGTNTWTGFAEGLNVCGGSVTIDAYGETISDLRVYGGSVSIVNSGAIAVLSAYAGTLDFSRLQRPLTITKFEDAPGCTIIPSKLLTITTRYPIGHGAEGMT